MKTDSNAIRLYPDNISHFCYIRIEKSADFGLRVVPTNAMTWEGHL